MASFFGNLFSSKVPATTVIPPKHVDPGISLSMKTMNDDLANIQHISKTHAPVPQPLPQKLPAVENPFLRETEPLASVNSIAQASSASKQYMDYASTLPNEPAKEILELDSLPAFHFPVWVMKSLVAVFAVLVVGGGVWYWQRVFEVPVAPVIPVDGINIPIPAPAPIPQPTPQPAPPTVDTTTVITVDITTTSPEQIRATLVNREQKFKDSGKGDPLTLKIVDMQGQPVSFATFAEVFELILPQELMAATNDFSLVLMNDAGYIHIGLDIGVNPTEVTRLENLLTTSEPMLVSGFHPLHLNKNLSLPTNVKFISTTYKGTAIRYFNILANGGISVDYAFTGNRLIIGTSKQSTYTMLDRLRTASAAQ